MSGFFSIFRRKPDFIIGDAADPYLLRWWIIPRNRIFNIYLHKFLRDDDDRALHDHPWVSLSIVLKGRYIEWLQTKSGVSYTRSYKSGSVIYRRATHRHRIELISRENNSRIKIPTWTLFITGPTIREWGFWCADTNGFRFVHWKKFTDQENNGITGKGCEQ